MSGLVALWPLYASRSESSDIERRFEALRDVLLAAVPARFLFRLALGVAGTSGRSSTVDVRTSPCKACGVCSSICPEYRHTPVRVRARIHNVKPICKQVFLCKTGSLQIYTQSLT